MRHGADIAPTVPPRDGKAPSGRCSFKCLGEFEPTLLGRDNLVFERPQLLGQLGDPDVIGLVVFGELGVLCRDAFGQTGELAVECGQLFLGGPALSARHRLCWRGRFLTGLGRRTCRELQVFVDAARQMAQLAVQDRVLLIGDSFEQIAVVRDDDHGAGPGVE